MTAGGRRWFHAVRRADRRRTEFTDGVDLAVIVETEGLTKRYRGRFFFDRKATAAVDNLDLKVEGGEIFGFLGPNGAGKTTTLNMLVGITLPSAGAIRLFGEPFRSGDTRPLERIGYVPESASLPSYLTVYEVLDFYGRLFGISSAVRRSRIFDILEMMEFGGERDISLCNLSMGQRRIVDLMQALINDPELILLDEPTVYLDPVMLERFRAHLLRLKKEGKTVIMSSHVLSEIERISDRIAIIEGGRLRKVAPKAEFQRAGGVESEFLRIVKHGHERASA